MPLIHTSYYTIPVPCWKRSGRVRLALLSDLHNNIFPGLLEILQREKPDYVLIAGDMVNRPTRLTPVRFGRGYGCVRKLAEDFPVYYALGNHESSWRHHEGKKQPFDRYQRALEKRGVVFLQDTFVDLGSEENPLRISGLELGHEQYTHHLKNRKAPEEGEVEVKLGQAKPFQILLVHHPFYLEQYAAWGADLVLAGHLHGGQIRLPGLGGLIASGFQFFPPYTKGLYEKGKTRMLVSAGLGTHTVPFRVFNPREVLIVDLVAENS